eukprot:6213509-Pleurochrysis_carterae.AAC.2
MLPPPFRHRPRSVRAFTSPRLPDQARAILVFIPRRLWPVYACNEHGGDCWTGRVLSLTKRFARVAFPFARDDHSRRYAPVRILHAHDC